MSVERTALFGNPNIGVYVFATESFSLIPRDSPEKFERVVEETLKVPVYRVSVSESSLIGVFVAGNSNGLVLSKFTTEYELETLKSMLGKDMNIKVLDDIKESALGNLVLVNDKAAIVSPLLDRKVLGIIEDVLGVEAVQREVAGSLLVSSVAITSNKGAMVYPMASEDEIKELSSILHVEVDVGTVNRGSIFLRSGMVVNTKGCVVGYDTTGPELLRIQKVFF
ncbi:MAG TPA: translation initiation factor IF-6 [Thermofilum sp.]|nr:MAG: translation initiation factor IF-6 [Thermoprotei archaeon]HDI31492.1 translation initiation factor IF-6 [Thermofilum sp.]